jgi:trigger factor
LEITREQTGKLTADILVRIEPADYKPQVDAELKRQAKKANMPGFRPGKVPVGVIRRMVGRAVVIETVQNVVSEALSEYLREQELNLVGNPMPKSAKQEEDFPADADQPMDFDFEIGLAPQVELNYDLADLPVRHEIEVDDEYLNKEINQYRERFGGVSQPEEVSEGDIFYGKLFEVDAEGEAVEEGFEQMVPFNPMRMEAPDFFKQFEGAKIDDVKDVDIQQISDDAAEIAKLLFVDEYQAPELFDKALKLQVKRINRMGIAEFNQEFFARMIEEFGWEEANAEEMDEASFREKMREHLAEQLQENPRWDYLGKLRDKMMEQHPLELPDEFLKNWLVKQDEKRTPEQVEEEYPQFVESQTWSLIVDEIMRQNPDLKVEQEELIEQMRVDLRRMLGGMGQQLAPEQENQYLQMMMENEEMVQNSYSRLITERVFKHLEEKIPPQKTEPITATAYFEMKEKEKSEEQKAADQVQQVVQEAQQAAEKDQTLAEESRESGKE